MTLLLTFPFTEASLWFSCLNLSDKAQESTMINKSIKFQAQARIMFKNPNGRAIMIE